MRASLLAGVALAAVLALPATAAASDPGRWRLVATTTIPIVYYQGVTPDRSGHLFWDGVFTGLYRTDLAFHQQAGVGNVFPAEVSQREGYNHIGDISWDRREGGRVLLPLECYDPGRGGNFCGNGAIGVADPVTLAWRYYVKLDPRDIPKAMWCEVSPDGRLLWTSSGPDLLAYRVRDISPAHAAPANAPIRPVRRLAGAVPPSGVTGATFYHGRLFLAGSQGSAFQVWSVSTHTGRARLEVERTISGESEGLATVRLKGGVLHWMIQPSTSTPPPTYPNSTLLTFARVHRGHRHHRR